MFAEDRAEFVRRDGSLTTTLDVVVSPEDDAEVRRVSIANSGREARDIEVTSYAEIVLAPPAADAAHQAFSKLFVETEYLPAAGAILATRRRRGPDEPELWAAHLAVVEGEAIGDVEFETDRARFLGRGNDIGNAVAANDGRRLSNTVGPVLDPVFALRRRLRVPAGGTVRIAYWTMVASSREALLDAVDKHRDANAFERAATLAWTQAQVQLRHLDIGPAQASLYQRLAGHVLYANPALRSSSDTIRRGLAPPPVLWAQGISGDLPIVLVRIDDTPGCRHRPRDAARPRILATEGPGGRPRHPQRARRLVRAGSADRASRPRCASARRRLIPRPSGSRERVRPAQRPDRRRDTRTLLMPLARVVLLGRPRQPGRPARPAADATRRAAGAAAPADPARPRPKPTCRRHAAAAICSSSTAWAASRPTAAST